MTLLAVGISHSSAPLPVLERVAAVAADRPLVPMLLDREHIDDVVLLATCNRVEVYAQTSRFHGGVDDVVRVLAEATGLQVADLGANLYVHYDSAAATHLFEVSAGLDSMAVGESQILGQVRAAWQRAREDGRLGRTLDEVFQQALRTGKRAQSETGLDRLSNTLVEHALDRAEEIVGGSRPPVLVVGAGAMAAVVVASLARRGGPATDLPWVTVVNRSEDAARRLASAYGVRRAPWERLPDLVATHPVVVTCTGAVQPVIDATSLAAARAAAPDLCQAFVDLALPRDVDPAAGELPGVSLLDLELLGEELALLGGNREIESARAIVAAEVAAWRAEQASTGVAPTVVALREQALQIIESELDRLDRRLPDLSAQSRAEIRNSVRRVVEKVLHTPTVRVKELADSPGGSLYAEALRTLFDLDLDPAATDSHPVGAVQRAMHEVTL